MLNLFIKKKINYTPGIHSRTVLSLEPDATNCPDGEKQTDNIPSFKIKIHIIKKISISRVKNSLCFSFKFLVIFLQIPCIFREISRKKYRKFYEKSRRFDRKFLMTFVAFFGLFRFE